MSNNQGAKMTCSVTSCLLHVLPLVTAQKARARSIRVAHSATHRAHTHMEPFVKLRRLIDGDAFVRRHGTK